MTRPRFPSLAVPSASAAQAARRPAASKVPSRQASARTESCVAPASNPRVSRIASSRPDSDPCRSTASRNLRLSLTSSRITASNPDSAAAAAMTSSDAVNSGSGLVAMRRSTVSRASASSSASVRSSTTAKWGATRASSGNWPSSDSQKEWMVRILSPPGVSSTSANSSRARVRSSSVAARPSRPPRSSCSAASLAIAHLPRRSLSRLAISAAAALVKVRQRILPGGVPASSRREIRSMRTRVLPVPALADTQTDWVGSAARIWAPVAPPTVRGASLIPRLRRSTIP